MVATDRSKGRRASKAEADATDRRIQCAVVARHISRYFKDIDVPTGFDLHCDRYIDMCLEVDTCGAVDAAYGLMKAQNRFQSSCGDGTMGEDIRMIIRLLKGIRAKCIPQEFSAGILLMHLEIVEGLRF